jgi:3-methyladenine DNA glycosylase AlkD
MPSAEEILSLLRSQANPANVAGMSRFGINPHNTLGVSIPTLRQIARQAGKSHTLAEELWSSGLHEARLLAAFVEDPKAVTEGQMERWVSDFDSWDVCDQVCSNLFDRTPYAFQKAHEWSTRSAEFTKRAGFVLMASLAVHAKKARDEEFESFFPLILQESMDERNYVKKAVNWALRGVGKRNRHLNQIAVQTALALQKIDSRSARWIAADALRELSSPAVQSRLDSKKVRLTIS